MKNYDVFIVRIIIVLLSGAFSLTPSWLVGFGLLSLNLNIDLIMGVVFTIFILLIFPLYRFFSGENAKTSGVMKKWLSLKLWATT